MERDSRALPSSFVKGYESGSELTGPSGRIKESKNNFQTEKLTIRQAVEEEETERKVGTQTDTQTDQ